MKSYVLGCALHLLLLGSLIAQQVQTINVSDPLQELDIAHGKNLLAPDTPELTFDNAGEFINATIGAAYHNEDCIIHIAKWKDATSLDSEHWYIFSQGRGGGLRAWNESDYKATRIFGSKKVWFIYVYRNVTTASQQDIGYKITVTHKQPANIQNLQALVHFLLPGAGAPTAPADKFNAKLLDIAYIPSDMRFSALLGHDTEQKEISSLTVDNEGRYYWDVGVSIPLKNYKDVEIDNNSGVITPKTITRQNAFATINVYPMAVDTKNTHLMLVPDFVFGLPLSGKPLDRYLVASGIGLNKVNAFAGITIERRKVVETGVTGTAGDQWIRKFTWGVNIPLRQFLNAVQNKK